MSDLNVLFRKRIGIPEDETITFSTLDRVLEKTAKTFPFENLCIIENKTGDITEESLLQKMLVRNEGGLCYELNSLLYLFLLENGFHVTMVRGDVYKPETGEYQFLGRTHLTILLKHGEQTYLVDTGFGANLPLKPVPLTGETVTSATGQFRVIKADTGPGDYRLELKLKHKDKEWRIGYAFDSTRPVSDLGEASEIQSIIARHPDSPFNKSRMVTKLTDRGNVTLTPHSLTRWEDGVVTKESIDENRFKELLGELFTT